MKMSRQDILLHSMAFAFQMEAWNPPLMKTLEGLTEEQVNWLPKTGSTHTIREIVIHLLFYKEQLLQRLQGNDAQEPTSNESTFTAKQDHSWEQILEKLNKVQAELQTCLHALEDEELDRPSPHVPIGGQILTLAMHDVYHTGQIVLLRKLQGTWPINMVNDWA